MREMLVPTDGWELFDKRGNNLINVETIEMNVETIEMNVETLEMNVETL